MNTRQATDKMMEFWVLEAKERCHDSLWANAEAGDRRALDKPVAEKIMSKNPGKFMRIDTLKYMNGEWSDMKRRESEQ